jgi:hypothetical protein
MHGKLPNLKNSFHFFTENIKLYKISTPQPNKPGLVLLIITQPLYAGVIFIKFIIKLTPKRQTGQA